MCISPDINILCFFTPLLSLLFSFPESMSLVFQRNDNTKSIRRSGCIHGMQCISTYDSPGEKNEEDQRRLSSEEDREEEDSGSCSSSSVGRNSDVSCGSSSDDEDSTEAEAQRELKGPLDTMDALEEVLPMRKGISNFYNGRSKSFTSLADAVAASSIKDFAKPDNPYNKKRKNLLTHGSLLEKNRNHSLRNSESEISKRVANSSRSMVALEAPIPSSSSSTSLPPLHPQYKKSTTIVSSSQAPRLNPPYRSLSLSDLQFVASTGLTVHTGDNDNNLH